MNDRVNHNRLTVHPAVISKPIEDGAEYWNLDTGRRVRVPMDLVDLLELLKIPHTIQSLVEETGLEYSYLSDVTDQLSGLDILVREDFTRTRLPHRGFFSLPELDFLDFYKKQEPVDAVIVGVPFDSGCLTTPGTRFGPAALRRNSWSIEWLLDDQNRVSGLYDMDEKKYLFHEASILDIGDLGDSLNLNAVHREEGLETIAHTVEYIVHKETLPIFIGGDHSITAATLTGFGKFSRIGVIQLDAHADFRERTFEQLDQVFHNNFVGYLTELPNVEVICQLGLRAPDYNVPNSKLKQHTLKETLAHLDSILDDLPDDIPYYVSVDLDVLDPVYMPNTGCFVPGGLRDQELVEILATIGRKFTVVGADFVEVSYDPIHDQRVGIMVTNLVLRFLSSALSKRKEDEEYAETRSKHVASSNS